MTGGETHKVVNQSPPYGGVNLFENDPLVNAAAAGFPDSVRQDLSELGAFLGYLARGAVVPSKPHRCTRGELQQNTERPPETDSNIPTEGWSFVEDDHIDRYERCDSRDECAGGACQRDVVRLRAGAGVGKSTTGRK